MRINRRTAIVALAAAVPLASAPPIQAGPWHPPETPWGVIAYWVNKQRASGILLTMQAMLGEIIQTSNGPRRLLNLQAIHWLPKEPCTVEQWTVAVPDLSATEIRDAIAAAVGGPRVWVYSKA